MRVLIGCECSGVVRRAFAYHGHFAVSVDIQAPEDGPSKWGTSDYSTGWHYQGDLIDFIYGDSTGMMEIGFDLAIMHPECTFLTNSGVRWLFKGGRSNGQGLKPSTRDKNRWDAMLDGAAFFAKCWNAPIPRIVVENPIMHMHAAHVVKRLCPDLPEPQYVQPWQFGHKEMKATGLYLKGIPPLVPTKIVGPPPDNPTERRKWAKVHQASPGPNRSRDRSRTCKGIGEAMAVQWGKEF